jgi:DNA-binding HxlR family transcriptional regulator
MAAEPIRKPDSADPAGPTAPETQSGSSSRALRLDRVIHERARLAIVSALAANEALSFTELKTILDVTDGNLSVHARKLEEAGYIVAEKTFRNRMPHTEYRLTPEGREALNRYIAHMEALIQAAKG